MHVRAVTGVNYKGTLVQVGDELTASADGRTHTGRVVVLYTKAHNGSSASSSSSSSSTSSGVAGGGGGGAARSRHYVHVGLLEPSKDVVTLLSFSAIRTSSVVPGAAVLDAREHARARMEHAWATFEKDVLSGKLQQ